MASQPTGKEKWTVDAYVEFESKGDMRYEYYDGRLLAKSGEHANHSQMAVRLISLMGSAIRQSGCDGFECHMRIKAPQNCYIYSDVCVVCGDAEFADPHKTMLTNPTMVYEVASVYSMYLDHIVKRELYLNIPSVQSYVIIEHFRPFVTVYTRTQSSWQMRTYKNLNAEIPLEQIASSLRLNDLYEDLQLEHFEQHDWIDIPPYTRNSSLPIRF